MSLNRTERRRLATIPAIALAMNQPIRRIKRKPMILGIAAKNIASAAVADVITAAVQSVTVAVAVGMRVSPSRQGGVTSASILWKIGNRQRGAK